MPTYDYQCQDCGHNWELFQSMNDLPVKACPKCKKRKAKRLLGLGAGVIFKGTGFYETDYKNKKPEKKESGSESSSKKNSKKENSKSGNDSNSKNVSKKDSTPQKKDFKTSAK